MDMDPGLRVSLLRARSRSMNRRQSMLDVAPSSVFDRFARAFWNVITPQYLALVSGPLAAAIILLIVQYRGFGEEAAAAAGVENKIGPMLGILVWMGIWWLFEPIPIAATALLPIALFPCFQIMNAQSVSLNYMDDIICLLLGTFIIVLAVEKYGLHKRLALKIILVAGGEKMDPRLLLLGFIIAPVFVSMWMSNTSAAAMVVPMATGLLKNFKVEHHVTRTKSYLSLVANEGVEEEEQDDFADFEDLEVDAEEAIQTFGKGVMLAVTYGVALGGMGTLIGSGPTQVLPGIYSGMYPDAPQISFLTFMLFALAIIIPWSAVLWLFLCWQYSPSHVVPVLESSLHRDLIEKDYESIGPMTFPELFISVEFCLLVLLWVTRTFGESPGWGSFFGGYPGDGTVAVAAAIVLFLVPNFKNPGEMIMDWKSCKNISWNVILLLGGGFALSDGIEVSGLATWIGMKMEVFEYVPYLLLTPLLGAFLSVVTEFTSNAACANIFLPIVGQVAVKTLNRHPLLLMLPATYACQYAFILPSGTPPNAIAFGTGYINVKDMVRPGLFMHVFGILLLSFVIPTLGPYVYGLDQPASSLSWI